MADFRTATALTIAALAFLNVLFLSVIVLTWGQARSLLQELDLEKRALAAQSEDLNTVSQERDSLLETEQALQKDLDEQKRKV